MFLVVIVIVSESAAAGVWHVVGGGRDCNDFGDGIVIVVIRYAVHRCHCIIIVIRDDVADVAVGGDGEAATVIVRVRFCGVVVCVSVVGLIVIFIVIN